MVIILRCGKYAGVSLDEIALGKKIEGGKAQGYFYFNQLANGDPNYFRWFQNFRIGMARWRVIHNKLNNFKPVYTCSVCEKETPFFMSVAGNSEYGYSFGREYICCKEKSCRDSLVNLTNGVAVYPLGFDTILNFGWSAGTPKSDEEQITKFLRECTGWKGSLNAQTATDFIDNLQLR
jgi:hypothetical protein